MFSSKPLFAVPPEDAAASISLASVDDAGGPGAILICRLPNWHDRQPLDNSSASIYPLKLQTFVMR